MTYAEPVYLNPDQVPSSLRQSYTGKMFKARICDTVTIPADAGLWDGGSRDTYTVIRMADGATIPAARHNAAPWDSNRQNRVVTLEPGICVVEHTMFCGKDMGLTFHIRADDVASMLPPPADELTREQKIVLTATACYKASYGGRNRFQMVTDGDRVTITQNQWDTAKQSLIELKMLNKAGAITVTGRNAAGRADVRDFR